ncbi:MAG: hypothetical protein ACYCU8_13110 [Ferrimicrobium acidiphilum]
MSQVLGPGTFDLEWSGIYGKPGLGATLAIKGDLTSRGYPAGAAAILFIEVIATGLVGGRGDIPVGTANPLPVVLGCVTGQRQVGPSLPPADETSQDLTASIRIDSAALEQLEDCRQGQDFKLRIDTELLLVNLGYQAVEGTPVHYQVHPQSTAQNNIEIKRADWGTVLGQWNRGLGIPIVVSLPQLMVGSDRVDIVRFLREAWRKVDDGDFQGAFVAARKSIELLRGLGDTSESIPKALRDQNVEQRLRKVVQSLFDLASAESHADGPTRDYAPTRADAIALVGAAAALTQCIFARMTT